MPHNFTAIDVGQGDAFYLKRDDVSILVDGGMCLTFHLIPRRIECRHYGGQGRMNAHH